MLLPDLMGNLTLMEEMLVLLITIYIMHSFGLQTHHTKSRYRQLCCAKEHSKSMKILKIILILSIILSIAGCSNKLIPGTYTTNFNTYGRFSKTLTLNCDSSVIMNFQGDMMNDNSYGNWRTSNDTLFISFDTTNYPDGRYKNDLTFIFKGQKLFSIPFSPEQYDELMALAADSIEIPNYRSLAKQLDKTPTNFKGNSKRQYFRKAKSFECEWNFRPDP